MDFPHRASISGSSRPFSPSVLPSSQAAPAVGLISPSFTPASPQPLSSAQLRRNRDKLVSLLEEGQLSQLASGEASTSATAGGHLAGAGAEGTPGDDELLPPAVDEPSPVAEGVTGRITIYCTAARWGGQGPEHPRWVLACLVLLALSACMGRPAPRPAC